MITDYILNVPTTTLLAEMPAATQEAIKSLGAEFPSFPMVGTQEVNGRKLIHVRLNQLFSKVDFDALLAAYSLDWQVYSIRSAYKEGSEAGVDAQGNATTTPVYISGYQTAKQDFLPFINAIVVTAEPFVTRPTALTDAIYLSTYAGTEPVSL